VRRLGQTETNRCAAPLAFVEAGLLITSRVMGEAQDIGLVLKRLRERAGLSQRQLAGQLGVQQPAVARWEAGGVQMPINRIEEILSHFGYGVEYDLTAVPIDNALNDGVPLEMVRRRPGLLPSRSERLSVRSGDYEFATNPDTGWTVDMWEVASGRKLSGAVAVYPERIDAIVPHPDGVLIRFGRTVGKVTPNAKRHDDGSLVFTYSLADQRDLELSGVSGDPTWPSPSF
jgi:transcriptional regulator with XRE-family HTH domain